MSKLLGAQQTYQTDYHPLWGVLRQLHMPLLAQVIGLVGWQKLGQFLPLVLLPHVLCGVPESIALLDFNMPTVCEGLGWFLHCQNSLLSWLLLVVTARQSQPCRMCLPITATSGSCSSRHSSSNEQKQQQSQMLASIITIASHNSSNSNCDAVQPLTS